MVKMNSPNEELLCSIKNLPWPKQLCPLSLFHCHAWVMPTQMFAQPSDTSLIILLNFCIKKYKIAAFIFPRNTAQQ